MRQKKEIDSTLREIEDIFVDEMIKKKKSIKNNSKRFSKNYTINSKNYICNRK